MVLMASCGADAHLTQALIFLATGAFSHHKPSKSLRLGNGPGELISALVPKQAANLLGQLANALFCIFVCLSVESTLFPPASDG